MQEKAKLATDVQLSIKGVSESSMAVPQIPFNVSSAGLSDTGLVRQNNEDVWSSEPDIGLYLLADGMGGHQAGEIAARETVNALKESIRSNLTSDNSTYLETLSDLSGFLRKAIVYANSVVYKMGKTTPNLRGMGTTLCCMLFHNKGLVFAHVGDSRIYRLRGTKLEQLTKDHSLLSELVAKGKLSENQVSGFLYKNIITKAMGTDHKIDPTIAKKRVALGDIYMMCSDGLSDLLSPEEISEILTKSSSIELAAKNFIDCANEKGGRDNITVLIAKIVSK